MPLPAWAAQAGLAALGDPGVQQGIYNVGAGAARGLGRGAAYLGEGAYNQLGNVADVLGGLGQQYLPQSINTLGGYARQGIGGLGRGIGGLANAIVGNEPGAQQVPQGAAMMAAQQGGMIGPQQMNPERAMQRQYMQQIQQPYQFDYTNQRQQLINQFNQQQLPQLARAFGGMNALDSGAFRRSATGALGNLQTNLGALEELGRFREGELNQNRLNQIQGYLGNQQQLGLGARRLGLEGTIAQRQDAIRQLGLMGGGAQQQQANYLNQIMNAINAQGAFGAQGTGQTFMPIVNQAQSSPLYNLATGLLTGGANLLSNR